MPGDGPRDSLTPGKCSATERYLGLDSAFLAHSQEMQPLAGPGATLHSNGWGCGTNWRAQNNPLRLVGKHQNFYLVGSSVLSLLLLHIIVMSVIYSITEDSLGDPPQGKFTMAACRVRGGRMQKDPGKGQGLKLTAEHCASLYQDIRSRAGV